MHRRDDAVGRLKRALSSTDSAEFRFASDGVDISAEVRRADLSRPRSPDEPGLLALVAARLGRTRLIDNLEFESR